jgi:hypothetical protein
MRRAVEIVLSDDDRQTLSKWARGRSTPARLMLLTPSRFQYQCV